VGNIGGKNLMLHIRGLAKTLDARILYKNFDYGGESSTQNPYFIENDTITVFISSQLLNPIYNTDGTPKRPMFSDKKYHISVLANK